MTLDELLADVRVWVEHRAREAAMTSKHARIRADGEDLARRTSEAQAKWLVEKQAALDAGQMPPPHPPVWDNKAGIEAQAYMQSEQMQMRVERDRILASLAEHVEGLLREREAQRLAALRPVVAELEAARAEAQEDVAVLREVLTAVQSGASVVQRPSPAERLHSHVTLDLIVHAAIVGQSLLDLAPVQPARTSPFDTDGERVTWTQEDNGVRLGLGNGQQSSYGTPAWPVGSALRGTRGVEI